MLLSHFIRHCDVCKRLKSLLEAKICLLRKFVMKFNELFRFKSRGYQSLVGVSTLCFHFNIEHSLIPGGLVEQLS